jgi:tetratricopeptide (TPR) repeat protein
MIERHYDDEALISLIESQRATSDAHLTGCESCNEKLESFQMIAEALHDADVWDTRPLRTEAVPATIATLRAFADRTADEDGAAVAILQELLAGAREEWMPRLAEHPEWRTAGVVRGLIAGSSRAIDTMPRDAVAMTALATDIAEHLDAASQPAGTIARLTGAAWRERAYSLYYTGDYSAAETALFAAERHLSYCVVNEYESARLGIVQALVLRSFERFTQASQVAAHSVRAFADFGDSHRERAAKMTEVHLLFGRSLWSDAETILLELEVQLCKLEDVDTHARVLANLAYCYRRLGRVDLAMRYYELATTLFDELGVPTEATRTRWNAAAMLVEAGRLTEASQRLRQVRTQFEHLGMISAAALVALDIAELLLADRRFEEVEEICKQAMSSFERAGLTYTTRAMTAIAFIHEAATQRVADKTLVRGVREYIERLPNQPNLLFAFAPA